jgi:hypothetical protein
MSHQNPDEVRAKNVEVMGKRCGALYTDLRNEILWLHAEWHQYRVLFGTSEARVQLLDRAAGFCFRILQDTLWEAVLLYISRLTDPPQARRRARPTLTLRRLPEAIPDAELAAQVRSLVGRATTASRFARDWRDRRIAHRDLALVQSEGAEPLTPASRADVERVLASLREIVNAVEGHYFRSEVMFDFVSPPNDAEALLYQLRLARMIQDERDARLKAGEYHPEDFRRPPEI